MKRRLTPVDYENIITYTEAHGWGSVKETADAFGVSAGLIVNIRSIYRAIMNDKPIPKSCLAYKSCIELVNNMKIKQQNRVYNNNTSSVVAPSYCGIDNNIDNLIDAYILEEEKKIIALEEELIKHKNNIKIAKDFAELLN